MNQFMKSWLCIATVIVASCCFISNAPILVCIASISGIIYVVGVASGHSLANLFGAILAACLAYLSYEAGFFGNVIMNSITLVLSLYGWWYWSTNQAKGSVIKRSLSTKSSIGLIILLVPLLVGSITFSFISGSALWYLDGITAILPIMATVLLVGAYKQQWYLWIPYNFLEILMWFHISSIAPEVMAILVMRVIFFVNSLIGYREWCK